MKVLKVVDSDQDESICIPKEFQMKDQEVYVKKVDDMLVLIPKNSIMNIFRANRG